MEVQKTGDIASTTGSQTGLIKNCKVGDLVIELGPDCAAAGEKVVVEAKEDSSYALAKARIEIETARKNRGANVGLFIFSAKTVPQGIDMLVRHGEDIFVIWDAERLESDWVLRAALSLAKAMCVRQTKQRDSEKGSWDEVDRAILAVEKEASRLSSISTWTSTIQSNSGKILAEIAKMGPNLERQIDLLREGVSSLKNC
jgi:hypothetical protein